MVILLGAIWRMSDAPGEKGVSASMAGVFFQGAGGVADVFQKAVSVRNVGVKSQLQGVKEMMRGAVHSFSY